MATSSNKTIAEIYGWLLLKSGKEIDLDGSLESLSNIKSSDIKTFKPNEDDEDDEANIYVVYSDESEEMLTDLVKIKNIVDQIQSQK